jgi:transcriptional regulator with XRE-family HTH domain
MIESRQIRAARALLNWSEEDLANAAGMDVATLQGYDGGPNNDTQTLIEIQDAFEKSGVEFLLGNGVRMRKQEATLLHGTDAYWAMLDDIYQTSKETGGEVCVLGIDEARVAQALDSDPYEGGEKLSKHINRLQKARIPCRKIIREGDYNIVAPLSWYRSIPGEFFSPNPMYIYGSKLGILHLGTPFKAVILDNPEIAGTLKRFFNFVWQKADPLQIQQNSAEMQIRQTA